ncbi:hypothetical protein [Rathayibacter iranicus]|nr:hypothetical protein [Rathayibacter iranicus]MWV32450.1 hypothetical protein [Rathayibacter iranicus NCPPB 2253 = VKM Ac-1602]
MSTFDESRVTRGQPQNAGSFAAHAHSAPEASLTPAVDAAAEPAPMVHDVRAARVALESAFQNLLQTSPVAAWHAWTGMQKQVRDAEYPRLIVTPGNPDEDTAAELRDPVTGQETQVIVVDRGERWSYTELEAGYVDSENIAVDYGDGIDGEQFVYLSSATGRPVRLPEGWTVS